MSFDNSASLIALLSLLRDKEVLDKTEVSEIKRHGELAAVLVSKGLLTEEEIRGRYEEVQEVIRVASTILRGHPATPAMIEVLRARRETFPALIEEIFRAMGEPL